MVLVCIADQTAACFVTHQKCFTDQFYESSNLFDLILSFYNVFTYMYICNMQAHSLKAAIHSIYQKFVLFNVIDLAFFCTFFNPVCGHLLLFVCLC